MKKIDLGQMIHTLANMGVIAGIIFLAVELSQNNELLSAQATAASTEIRLGTFRAMLENPELTRTLAKSQRGEELTDEESMIQNSFFAYVTTGFQYSYQEFASGRADIDGWPVGGRTWTRAFNGASAWPGFHEYWDDVKFAYEPEFVAWMDRNVVEP